VKGRAPWLSAAPAAGRDDGAACVGGGRHLWVLFVPKELTKRRLAPPTNPQRPAAAFKCAGQIKGPQESPRSWLRRSLSPDCILGAKHPVPPSQGPPEPRRSPSSPWGSWGVKGKSPFPTLCPSQLLLENLCLQARCGLHWGHQLEGEPSSQSSRCDGCHPLGGWA